MIPVPQPKAPKPTGDLDPRHPGPDPSKSEVPTKPRRNIRLLIGVGAAVIVVLVVAVVATLVFVMGLRLDLVALVVAFIVLGAISVLLRLLPSSMPLIRPARSVAGLASFAALVGFVLLFSNSLGYPSLSSLFSGFGTGSSGALTTTSTVVFEITGTTPSANIDFVSAGHSNATGSLRDQAVPFTRTFTVKNTVSSSFYSLTANTPIGDDAGAPLTCSITVDGVVIDTHTENSGAHIVMCSGSSEH